MAAQIPLGQLAAAADSVEYSGYAYTSGTVYWEFVGRDATTAKTSFHFITYAGTPDSTHNNAPLPSLFLDTTNKKLYIKTAASTWTVVGAQS